MEEHGSSLIDNETIIRIENVLGTSAYSKSHTTIFI